MGYPKGHHETVISTFKGGIVHISHIIKILLYRNMKKFFSSGNINKSKKFLGNFYIDEWYHNVFFNFNTNKFDITREKIIEEIEERCVDYYCIFTISVQKLFDEINLPDEKKLYLLKYYNEKLNISEKILKNNNNFDIYIFSFKNKSDALLINFLFK
jgi:hypothetical protein